METEKGGGRKPAEKKARRRCRGTRCAPRSAGSAPRGCPRRRRAAADPAAMARMLAGMRPRGPGLNEVPDPGGGRALARDERARAAGGVSPRRAPRV